MSWSVVHSTTDAAIYIFKVIKMHHQQIERGKDFPRKDIELIQIGKKSFSKVFHVGLTMFNLLVVKAINKILTFHERWIKLLLLEMKNWKSYLSFWIDITQASSLKNLGCLILGPRTLGSCYCDKQKGGQNPPPHHVSESVFREETSFPRCTFFKC